jgi:hypothetical protein
MIGEDVTAAEQEQEKETLEEAYGRFLANYAALGGVDMDWFEQHVPSLLSIAVEGYNPQARLDNLLGASSRPSPSRLNPRKILLTSDAFIDFYTAPAAVALAG